VNEALLLDPGITKAPIAISIEEHRLTYGKPVRAVILEKVKEKVPAVLSITK